jgi:hypothetical protein
MSEDKSQDQKSYHNLIRQHAEYKKVKAEKYQTDSKDRLSKILKKKVITTMIGSLSSIEKHFGFLWEASPEDLTDEQRTMYDIYQKTRQEILDKGNAQAKNIDAELAQYEIKWLRYNTVLPVKKEEQ